MYLLEMSLLSTFILLSGIFTVILGVLFIPAMLELVKPSDEVTLPIEDNQANNPRMDALNLRKAFQESKPTSPMMLNHLKPSAPLKGIYKEPIFVSTSVQAEKESSFLSETYLQNKGVFGPNCSFSKLACDNNLTLGASTKISDWVDAEGDLQIGQDSIIDNKATCTKTLTIEKNCSFRSLYAHPIQTYHSPKPAMPAEQSSRKTCSISQSAIYISPGLTTIPPSTITTQDIIVKGDLEIGAGSHFEKSIKCSGTITLGTDVTVKGNIFADKGITIGSGSKIEGDIFSQQTVLLKDHVTVGEQGKVKSVIGIQGTTIENDVRIYGYLHTYGQGNIS
jgi:predicted acyltransferase (DUF342 family)